MTKNTTYGEPIEDLVSRIENGYIELSDLSTNDRRLVRRYQKEHLFDGI